MTGPVAVVLTALIAYLIGAIPFGYLVAHWHGVDIFQHGSGNIGATNVGRVLGKKLGILVFALDFAKGAVPTLAARHAGVESLPPDLLPVVAGLAAFLGHMFPVYLRFRGGKGVATGAGVVAVLLPWPALGALIVWIAVVSATRYVSLASLAAALALCGLHFHFVAANPFAEGHVILTVFCFVAAALVCLRHHTNIARLSQGTENRLPESTTMLTFTKTVHVLALGLWFGSVVFFTFIVGLSLFHTLQSITASENRPYWLPAPAELKVPPPSPAFPNPLTKEQGGRIFGAAVGPMFTPYFLLQGVCAALALATAWGWDRLGGVHKWRKIILVVGLASVILGWWLNGEAAVRQKLRVDTSDAVLLHSRPAPAELISEANAAREDFGRWHTYSLFANFLILALVTVSMALAAQLPSVEVPNPNETKLETLESS